MKNNEGNELIKVLKEQGYEVDWDWGDENQASLSKVVEDEIIVVLLDVRPV